MIRFVSDLFQTEHFRVPFLLVSLESVWVDTILLSYVIYVYVCPNFRRYQTDNCSDHVTGMHTGRTSALSLSRRCSRIIIIIFLVSERYRLVPITLLILNCVWYYFLHCSFTRWRFMDDYIWRENVKHLRKFLQ